MVLVPLEMQIQPDMRALSIPKICGSWCGRAKKIDETKLKVVKLG
jgi:hypothetical protein